MRARNTFTLGMPLSKPSRKRCTERAASILRVGVDDWISGCVKLTLDCGQSFSDISGLRKHVGKPICGGSIMQALFAAASALGIAIDDDGSITITTMAMLERMRNAIGQVSTAKSTGGATQRAS